MFEINCPFCNGKSVSDVIDSIEQVNGQWECSNGHQFTVQYIRKMDGGKEVNENELLDKILHIIREKECSPMDALFEIDALITNYRKKYIYCNKYEPREEDNE